MVGIGETYIPAFALAVGLGEVTAGLTATVPMVAGAVLQMVSPRLARRFGSHRRWVVVCAAAQALCFGPLVWAALLGRISAAGVLLIATGYWGFGLAAAPAWNTWMARLVPTRLRTGFFATRTRALQVAVLAGLLTGGIILQWTSVRGAALAGFALLFAVAGCARLISTAFLAAQGEPDGPVEPERMVAPHRLLHRLRHAEGRLLLYMASVQVMAQMAAPYFTPFMLKQLRLSYGAYMLLLAAAYLAKALASPLLGRFAHRSGAKHLLWFGGLGIVPLAALWMVSSAVPYLLVIQLLAGVLWGAYELASFLLMLETIPNEERTSILTTFNLLNAVAIATGSLIGGAVLRLAGGGREAYLLLFLVSSAGRLLTLPLLRRVIERPLIPAPLSLIPMALRPAAGSIDDPILPGIAADGDGRHNDKVI